MRQISNLSVALLSILLAPPVVSVQPPLAGVAASPKFIGHRPGANFVVDESADYDELLETSWRTYPRTERNSARADKKTKWEWRSCKEGKSAKSPGKGKGSTKSPSSSKGKGKSGKSTKVPYSYCGDESYAPHPAPGASYPSDGSEGSGPTDGAEGSGPPPGSGETPWDGDSSSGNGETDTGGEGSTGGDGETGTGGQDSTGGNGETDGGVGEGSIPGDGGDDGTDSSPSPGGSGITTPYPWPVPDDSTNDVTTPDDATCDAVQEQGPIPALAESETRSELSALLEISYDFPPYLRDGVATELRKISPVIALWVAGCESQAQALADSLLPNRRLEESLDISYVSLVTNPSGPAPLCEQGESCLDSFRADFQINHDENVPESVLRERIIEAYQVFADLLNLIGLGAINLNTGNINVENTNNFDSALRGGDSVEDSMNVAAVIGATAGGLAFILLLVLLIRKRQAEDEVSHLKLDEDDDYVREIETASSGQSGDENYESRNVHVVGEADSIYSGWTGYTRNNGRFGEMEEGDGFHGDVHKCSSATCEVCEQRRQQGIQFVPTRSPSRPKLPSDTSREYIAEDTVEL